MREQKLYICDVCSCRYYDKREAIKCEACHQKKIRIIKKVLHGEGDDAMQAAHKKQSWPCCSVQEGSTLLGRREHA